MFGATSMEANFTLELKEGRVVAPTPSSNTTNLVYVQTTTVVERTTTTTIVKDKNANGAIVAVCVILSMGVVVGVVVFARKY